VSAGSILTGAALVVLGYLMGSLSPSVWLGKAVKASTYENMAAVMPAPRMPFASLARAWGWQSLWATC
jgi:hypothetical protein